MDDPIQTFESLRSFWRNLFPGGFERGLANAAVFAGFYFVLVLAIERACGTRTANYRSRGFAHDLAYYFYAKGGLQRFLIPATLFSGLADSLTFLDLKLLAGLPYPVQLVCWLLVSDCIGYWVHRAKHEFRFLWAFHTTHHSQEHVTFATYARAHPVEELIGLLVNMIVLLLLGASPLSWLLIYLIIDLVGELQHTQIPWRGGPLYWIFVTPPFHLYHHSADPAHRDRNFGTLFSFWDHLFGTAVARTSPRPSKFGLDDVKPTSLWSTFVDPFRLLFRFYAPAYLGNRAGPSSQEPR